MPKTYGRFLDSWVVDRVMFEYVNQGGCNCCGFTHAGMDMNDFMQLCSDVETDDGKKEKLSPWPPFMQDEIWADRVKVRKSLKESMAKYRERTDEYGMDFVDWWLELPVPQRRRCFQMPKEEVHVQFNTTFDIRQAYQTVMCAVIEQVQKFRMTKYKADGATECELFFENRLRYERGAWLIDDLYYSTEEGCDMFFGMMLQLGGDHLLPKRSKELQGEGEAARKLAEGTASDEDEANDEGEGTADGGEKKGGQSFRSDRRLVRLVIFRYFADMAWRGFERHRRKLAEEAVKLKSSGDAPEADPATPPVAPEDVTQGSDSNTTVAPVVGLETTVKKGFLLSSAPIAVSSV